MLHAPYSLLPAPCSLLHAPCSLLPTPCSMLHAPYSPYPARRPSQARVPSSARQARQAPCSRVLKPRPCGRVAAGTERMLSQVHKATPNLGALPTTLQPDHPGCSTPDAPDAPAAPARRSVLVLLAHAEQLRKAEGVAPSPAALRTRWQRLFPRLDILTPVRGVPSPPHLPWCHVPRPPHHTSSVGATCRMPSPPHLPWCHVSGAPR